MCLGSKNLWATLISSIYLLIDPEAQDHVQTQANWNKHSKNRITAITKFIKYIGLTVTFNAIIEQDTDNGIVLKKRIQHRFAHDQINLINSNRRQKLGFKLFLLFRWVFGVFSESMCIDKHIFISHRWQNTADSWGCH